MELLRLSVFVLLIQVSLAVWQRLTVKKGQTVDLKCPITDADQTNVDWKNPEGYIMFFKHSKVSPGVRDKRYSINKLSQSEFNVRISDVTFKDGGNYTCSQYGDHITEKIVEVTVLGHPKITRTKHDGRFDIKCSAEGNSYPPLIFWKFNHGPEILAHYQVLHEDKKYVSMAILRVQSVESRVTVKCLVRHPALHSQPLMNFVKIGQESKSLRTTTTSSPTARPSGSTEGPRTTTSWFRPGKTTVYLATTDVNGHSSESSIKFSAVPSNQLFSSNKPKTVTAPTGFPLNTVTTPDARLATSDNSTTSVLLDSTSSRNVTISNATSSTGWTSVSATTEITSYNSTEGNRTGSFDDPKMRTGSGGGSSLLVFLVTCLICGLLVVVTFFAIKLRRAHIAWKRVFIVTENEDSDPSEESSKSKSSQEDKNSQGQRRRGIFNTAFTQYVVEEPPVITSVVNTAAMAATESANEEQTSQRQTPETTFAKCDIKETEL
ncbi:cytotoxic and regulatory T-cell molecule isoform X2 [Dicentrarchus labrax]|uniref:cytotoxic and regulatory T-cell molecule isoform X2 n=1 Tax=Dicentrarchus labrax TaxID=13489 RepID=UPI0021F58AB8|nr:cytotoxic and regulatory T-cell molecule isoform X2 [Dicentrarchus labrax]